MASERKLYSLLARFDTPHAIYEACKKVREAGYQKWDSYTPFPVHGLDKAMGLKPSVLPWIVLVAGVTGAISAIVLMVWASAYAYPLNVGGKPTWSIPAFIPIMFEVTVLFGGLTATFAMFVLNRMPQYHHPLFSNPQFSRVTDDQFFIEIRVSDPKFRHDAVEQFLKECGALSIERVEEDA